MRRKLAITQAGYWYVVLTIAMGVVALLTANNVLYLMECLLLGGLILSGVISEQSISSVQVEWVRRQAQAGRRVRDQLVLDNPTRFAFFCLEVGEWRDGRFERLAFVTKIDARSRVAVPVERVFGSRGLHRWDGIAVATAAPFGFARKTLIRRAPGERLVWPARHARPNREFGASALMGAGFADAEVRPHSPGEDVRNILWKLSAKGGDLVSRLSRRESPRALLTLRLRAASAAAFEGDIAQIAHSIYRSEGQPGSDVRLRVLGSVLRRTITGRVAALNYLATAQPEAIAAAEGVARPAPAAPAPAPVGAPS